MNNIDNKYYLWDTANATRMGEYLTRKEGGVIESFLKHNNIEICLDVACGSGRFSIPISQHGINVVALDYNLVPLRKLKDKKRENIMIIRGDLTKLPLKMSSFDCIVSIETVDYLDPKKVFRECNRVSRKGGFLILTMGNNRSYKKYIYQVLGKHKFYRYSFNEIKSYLKMEGFNVLKCHGYNWIPFKRNSNSVLLGLFEFLENILRLSHFPSISPAVFFIAKKEETT